MNTLSRKERFKAKMESKKLVLKNSSILDQQSSNVPEQNSDIRKSLKKADFHKQENKNDLNESQNMSHETSQKGKKRKCDDATIEENKSVEINDCVILSLPDHLQSTKPVFEKILPYCEEVILFRQRSLVIKIGSEAFEEKKNLFRKLAFEGRYLKVKPCPRFVNCSVNWEIEVPNFDGDPEEVKKHFNAISIAPRKLSKWSFVLTFESNMAANEAELKSRTSTFLGERLCLYPIHERVIFDDEGRAEIKAITISNEGPASKKMKANTGTKSSVKLNDVNDNEDESEDDDGESEGEKDNDDVEGEEDDDDVEGEEDDDDVEGEEDDDDVDD